MPKEMLDIAIIIIRTALYLNQKIIIVFLYISYEFVVIPLFVYNCLI